MQICFLAYIYKKKSIKYKANYLIKINLIIKENIIITNINNIIKSNIS